MRKKKVRIQLSQKNERKIFDWCKAARLIRDKKPLVACAYLRQQQLITHGIIWKDDNPYIPFGMYLQSSWDVPMLSMDSQSQECWIPSMNVSNNCQMSYRTTSGKITRVPLVVDGFSVWPESALKIVDRDLEL